MTSLLPTLPRAPALHPRAVLQWVKVKAVPLPSFPLVGAANTHGKDPALVYPHPTRLGGGASRGWGSLSTSSVLGALGQH